MWKHKSTKLLEESEQGLNNGTNQDHRTGSRPAVDANIRNSGRPKWKPEPPFTSHIPPPQESIPGMYEKLLDPLIMRDRAQCSAWNDEVQNLLIFAGLFSAVVTAFIIETYKGLQPDPNDQIIGLLARIADRLDNGLSPNSTVLPSVVAFSPTPSIIRVNIFWFLSLVLSLTTVLVGIVSLQWLREHQSYDATLDPQIKFAIFNMRAEALKRWHVPQIFAVLPLILQGALLLFLVGAIDFLIALNKEVAIPVTVAIVITILFLAITTILPTLQAYNLHLPFLLQVNNSVPTPCPYKSPQALITARLALWSKVVFRMCAYCYAIAFIMCISVPRYLFQLIADFCEGLRREWNRLRTPRMVRGDSSELWSARSPGPAFLQNLSTAWNLYRNYFLSHQSWIEAAGTWGSSEDSWLIMRMDYFTLMHEVDSCNTTQTTSREPLIGNSIFSLPATYDCLRGFHAVIREGVTDEQSTRLYHCNAALARETVETIKDWYSIQTIDVTIVNDALLNYCYAITALLGPSNQFFWHPLSPQDVAKPAIPRLWLSAFIQKGSEIDFNLVSLLPSYNVIAEMATDVTMRFSKQRMVNPSLQKEYLECHARLVASLLLSTDSATILNSPGCYQYLMGTRGVSHYLDIVNGPNGLETFEELSSIITNAFSAFLNHTRLTDIDIVPLGALGPSIGVLQTLEDKKRSLESLSKALDHVDLAEESLSAYEVFIKDYCRCMSGEGQHALMVIDSEYDRIVDQYDSRCELLTWTQTARSALEEMVDAFLALVTSRLAREQGEA